jgi:transposase
LAENHAACDVLELDSFVEDDLYANLDWISENQATFELGLFKMKNEKTPIHVFLYDVTSSYFEGEKNEYADWGYNRDRKKGKKQIVVGLLADQDGDPLSTKVFRGNTADNKTVEEQVVKIVDKFHVSDAIFVGDRGMVKGPQEKQIEGLTKYISAITTAQIRTLISKNVITLEMFENDHLNTVVHNGHRYVLRRNPARQEEITHNREEKIASIKRLVREKEHYLQTNKRAKVITAAKEIRGKINKLGLKKWITVTYRSRKIVLKIDEEKLKNDTSLDGCYVLKSNVDESIGSDCIHNRYKDLVLVEMAFRTVKTGHLEVRPHYVRKASRTEGHVFVVMLAYKMIRYLREAWKSLNITVEEGIDELDSICLNTTVKNGLPISFIPKPRKSGQALIDALNVKLPTVVPDRGVTIVSRKKLVRGPSKRHRIK